MIKIGITGSIASGKTTVAKILSKKKYPLFSADKIVKKLYKKKTFLKKLKKIIQIEKNKYFKKNLREIIYRGAININHSLRKPRVMVMLKC